jgi:hypothetical protein
MGAGTDDDRVEAMLRECDRRLHTIDGNTYLVDVAEELAGVCRQIIADRRASVRQVARAVWTIGYLHWLADLQEYDQVPPWVFLACATVLDPENSDWLLALASESKTWLGKNSAACQTIVAALLRHLEHLPNLTPEQRAKMHGLADGGRD